LLDRKRNQLDCGWDDPRLALLNLRFSMVDEGMSLARALEKGGFESLFALDEIQQASREAPAETRAGGRAELLRRFPDQLWAASWMAILVDIGKPQLVRVQFPDPHHPTRHEVQKAVEMCEAKLGSESENREKLVTEVLQALGVELPADLKYYSWDEGYYASESFKEQFEKGK
ncbi:peptidase, partial [Mobiluncus curtisii]